VSVNDSLGGAGIFDSRSCTLGEGPLWHPESGRVLWVDILQNVVHWQSLSEGNSGSFSMPSHVGAFLPREDGTWLALLQDGAYAFDESRSSCDLIAPFPHHLPAESGVARMRANDAAVSPWGQVVCGTMPYDVEAFPQTAQLYHLEGTHLRTLVEGVTISNGIGWSPDHSQMYYVDTPTTRIDVFDCSPSLELSNRRVFASIDESLGWPDGLALDRDGYVWLALWGGSRVQRFAPDGSLAGYVEVPCANVTSCAFVGEDLSRLVITTANLEHETDEAAGKTYIFDTSTSGLPLASARV
jgi:sugar lactone lactonase YvrE